MEITQAKKVKGLVIFKQWLTNNTNVVNILTHREFSKALAI
jgi:hypothetical protein